MSPRTLTKVEELAGKNHYWTRSFVINRLLTALMDYADEDELYTLMRFMRWYANDVKISIKISIV